MPESLTREPQCRYEPLATGSRLFLQGAWQVATLSAVDRTLRAHLPAEGVALPVAVDGSDLDVLDTAGALLLRLSLSKEGLAPGQVDWSRLRPTHQSIVDLVCAHLQPATAASRVFGHKASADPAGRSDDPLRADVSPVAGEAVGAPFLEPVAFGHRVPDFPARTIGRKIVDAWDFVTDTMAWFGRILAALAQVVRQPGRLRPRELFAQLGQVCVSAVPVVALVSFLIGLVIAYLLGLQATQYGANIFVIDGVALGLAREFSPLIVAVILAGRSGSAFAAQLGTMRLTEEIDAIRMLGLPVEQVLLVPRVIALVLALPLLVFVADVVGVLGAMVIADHMLGIGPAQFMERLQVALNPRHLLIGLAKAPVFALAIAVVGCRMGMTVPRDARSIGRHTTSTVVQSIVSVIVLDALFAVLLQALGW